LSVTLKGVAFMPRPRKNTERWSHPLYRMGVCLNRKGTVYTEIGGVRTTTGLTWHEKNRKAALQILEKRVLEVLNPSSTLATEKMLVEAIEEFSLTYLPNVSRGTQLQFRRAFVRLLPNNVALSDTDALRGMLIAGLSEYQAENNTKRALLKQSHTFFEFCIRQGWITKNPAKLVVKPKSEKTEINPFTREDVQRMVSYNREAGRVEFALLLDFLGQTAMRIGEAMKLHWSAIDERKIIVDRKGRDRARNSFEAISALV
jgi:integrase